MRCAILGWALLDSLNVPSISRLPRIPIRSNVRTASSAVRARDYSASNLTNRVSNCCRSNAPCAEYSNPNRDDRVGRLSSCKIEMRHGTGKLMPVILYSSRCGKGGGYGFVRLLQGSGSHFHGMGGTVRREDCCPTEETRRGVFDFGEGIGGAGCVIATLPSIRDREINLPFSSNSRFNQSPIRRMIEYVAERHACALMQRGFSDD